MLVHIGQWSCGPNSTHFCKYYKQNYENSFKSNVKENMIHQISLPFLVLQSAQLREQYRERLKKHIVMCDEELIEVDEICRYSSPASAEKNEITSLTRIIINNKS